MFGLGSLMGGGGGGGGSYSATSEAKSTTNNTVNQGGTKFGDVNIGAGSGGSGISTSMIAILAGAAVLVAFFFFRK